MSSAEEVRLSMTVMINKEKTKVLCAVLDSNLADILLSFFTLPLGRIQQLLQKHYGDQAPTVGSLNTLYKGLLNLDTGHFGTERGKLMLLYPKSTLQDDCGKLKINLNDTQPQKYLICGNIFCTDRQDIISLYDDARCFCGGLMDCEIEVVWNELDDFVQADVKGEEEAFTEKTTSFLITDDLRMIPNVDKSILQSIKDLGLMYADGATQLIVTIGFNEIMEMLKLSLLSKTPLTDLIFPTKAKSEQFSEGANSISEKFNEQFPLPPAEKNEGENSSSKTFKVKATVHKSTRKLLFVQAEEDFIDFLFSLLTIPIGKVGSLLGGNTSLGSIDNLYSSLANLDAVKFLKTASIKNMLLDPEFPPQYLSKNQILSLSQQKPRDLYYHSGYMGCKEHLSPSSTGMPVFYMDPKGRESYVKGPRLYMVTDDLTVTPLCMLSAISTLDELKIPYFDVDEVELDVGIVEGLSILKASLTSTSALTDALILTKKKHPKQEEE